jgi:hypothetical protein
MNTDRENLSDFEWHTEEDDAPILVPEISKKSAGRRWLVPVAFVLVAAFMVALVASTYLRRQVDNVTAVARVQLLASHGLLDRAASQGDGELVASLLLDHDPVWAALQQELLEAGLFLDRAALGWTATGQAPDVTAVRLSPDWQRAEVVFQQQYIVTGPNGREQTALFEHTAVYHHNGEQWLLAPPAGDFWGGWRGSRGQRLNLIFPERDGAVPDRLAGDLDMLIDEMCRTLDGLNCPADLRVEVRLEQELLHLQRLLDGEATLTAAAGIDLPALTLMGLPLNEAAYQALYQEYAVRVAATVIGNLVEWSCCERLPFYQAMLDKQLSQLGLRPWPLTDDHYRYMLHSPPRMLQLGRYWHRSLPAAANIEDGWLLYAFVDFADHAAPELSTAARQRLLSQAEDYTDWVEQALNTPDDAAEIWQWDGRWLLFAHGQLAQAQEAAGTAWPEQEIALACWPTAAEVTNGDGYPLALRRLEASSTTWLPGPELMLEPLDRRSPQTGLPRRGFAAVALPGYQGVVLHVETTTEAGRRLQLFDWRGGSLEPLFDSAVSWPEHGPHLFDFTAILDPTGELLLFRDYASSRGEFTFWLFDTAACRRGICEIQSLPGGPVWSPDGRRTLLVSDVTRANFGESVSLLLADRWGANAVPLAEGYAPFWLDNETVAYFQRRPGAALFTVNVAGSETEPSSALANAFAISRGIVRQAAVHPADPEWLFFLLEARQRFVGSVHLGTGEQLIYQPADAIDENDLLHLPVGSLHADVARCPDQNCWRTELFHLSPDGRWLATVNDHFLDSQGSSWFVFHDLHQEFPSRLVEAPVTLPVADTGGHNWSADGRWFLLPHRQVVPLYSPTTDTFQYQILEQNCFFSGWLDGKP